MLFLIATPIGNLKDITLRALETIKLCDYLLCEDTRRTQILLAHYEIRVPLKSYHAFNEASKEEGIIADLKKGQCIGIVSDAGMPGIADPGERLVRRCRLEGIEISALPGPCALITALTASGFSCDPFQFLGFLPKKRGRLVKTLEQILAYPGTTVCYESPFRLHKTLELIASLDPKRQCAVARELTKKFETHTRGSAEDLFRLFQAKPAKGEVVLMVSVER